MLQGFQERLRGHPWLGRSTDPWHWRTQLSQARRDSSAPGLPSAGAAEISASDPLHAMQVRPPPPPQVRDACQVQRPSVSDRDCPPDTARDRCLWHVGGTAGEDDDVHTWRRRLLPQPLGEARPHSPLLVGKPSKTARQPGVTSSL
jgi:hypothetical protein